MDCSPLGSSVHGILPARILEWVVMPSPEDLPGPGIEPISPSLIGGFFTPEPLGKLILQKHYSEYVMLLVKARNGDTQNIFLQHHPIRSLQINAKLLGNKSPLTLQG